jgi:hypothetical protein
LQIGTIPRLVVLILEYYMVDIHTKRLVSAVIQFPTPYQCISLTSGGTIQSALIASGVPKCVQDIDGAVMDFGYNLEILYTPLKWVALLNAFQVML